VVWWCAPEPASLAEEAQFRNNLKLTTQLEVSAPIWKLNPAVTNFANILLG
jgi:hypothetical protein